MPEKREAVQVKVNRDVRPPPRKYTKEDIAEVQRLYVKEGLPMQLIAKQMGYPYSMVRYHTHRKGLVREKLPPSRGKLSREEMSEIKRSYAAGEMDKNELAAKYNVHGNTIHYHVKGLKVNNKEEL
jgi:DNA-binding CsgD family transcriptional regulator